MYFTVSSAFQLFRTPRALMFTSDIYMCYTIEHARDDLLEGSDMYVDVNSK